MKKRLLSLLLLCTLVFALSGCGEKTLLNKKKPVSLSFWHVYGEQAGSPMDLLVQEFNRTVGQERGVQVKVTGMSSASQIGGYLKEAQSGGKGVQYKKRKIKVNIPAGIDDGQIITISGEGEAGTQGGPPGDINVVVSVRPHEIFERSGPDLYMKMDISFVRAALGGDIIVPTIDQPVKYHVPEGTQPGAIFRLKGQGMPRLRGIGRGDLYVTLNIEVPKKLTEKQRQMLLDFEDSLEGREPKENGFGKIFHKKK